MFNVPSFWAFKILPESLDPDAKAFLIASGTISDPIISNAINNFVIGMKANGWWSLCKIIYPIVGGIQNSHKYNLKDPQDLDSAFRLTFTSGWTHNSNGMSGNGVGWADTKFVPSIDGTQNQHIAENCITTFDGNVQEIGYEGVGTELSMWMSVFGGLSLGRTYGNNDFFPNGDSNAFQIVQRQFNTQSYGYNSNGGVYSNVSTSFAGFPTPFTLTLGGKRFSGGGVGGLSPRFFNYISVGTAIPQAQIPNYDLLVAQLQTDLGR